MGEVIDFSALTWVKQGLDETLAQARDTLESYVSDPDDVAPLRACIASLHQVKGTLTMMETHAAADLAGDMEETARALLDKQVDAPSDAYESIMRAILQLPDYLEWLQSGKQDQPQLLAPLRNDLRKARGLKPEAAPQPKQKTRKTLPDAAVRKVAQQTRTVFQSGLIGLVKGDVSEEFSKRICISLGNLERACLTPNVNRVWVLASGVLEAVTEGGLETSLTVKKLFGQLDREIKRLSDSGEQALEETPNLELIDALEGLVQTASQGGAKLEAARKLLKDQADQDAASPDDLILGDAGGLSGVNTQVLETVSGAVREDLTIIKESLDVFTRSEPRNLSDLEQLRTPLRKIADTLQMIGLQHPHTVVLDMCNLIDEANRGEVTLHDQSLLEMATAVLFVESALNGLAEGRPESDGDADEVTQSLKRVRQMSPDDKPPVTQSALPDSEFQQVAAAVVREANIDLAKSKDAIVAFIATPFDETILSEIPESYGQIHGALSLLGMKRAADQLNAIKIYIERRLLGNKSLPNRDHLDRLAESISAIEYYLESVTQQRMDTGAILDMADECLADLGYPFDNLEPDISPDILDDTALDLPGLDDLDSVDDTSAAGIDHVPDEATLESSGDQSVASPEGPITDEPHTPTTTDTDESGIPEADLDAFMPEGELNEVDYTAPSESSWDVVNAGTKLATGGLIAAAMGADHLTGSTSPETEESPPDQSNHAETSDDDTDAITLESLTDLESPDPLPADNIELESETATDLSDQETPVLLGHQDSSAPFDDAARQVLDLHSDEQGATPEVPEIDLSGIKLESEADHYAAFDAAPSESDPEEPTADSQEQSNPVESAATDAPENSPSEGGAVDSQLHDQVEETEQPTAVDDTLAAALTYGLPILDEDSDPDILEIFMEEAQEELEAIHDRLPLWLESDDSEALGDVRRSYHTLKGSGRMAGAKKLGEYAWAFESLLNSIMEGQITIDQRLRSVIEEGSGETLVGLVAQLENQSLPVPARTDLLCLRAQALRDEQIPFPEEDISSLTTDATVHSDDVSADEPPAEDDTTSLELAGLAAGALAAEVGVVAAAEKEQPVAVPSVDADEKVDHDLVAPDQPDQPDQPETPESLHKGLEPDSSSDPDGIDPILFEIFSNETFGHLDTLTHFVDEGRQRPETQRDANDELRRALHTILGSARTAGITDIADLAGPLDQYIKDIHGNNERLSENDLDLLQDSENVIRNLIGSYPDNSAQAGDIDAMLNRISGSFSSRTQHRVDDRTARQSEEEELLTELESTSEAVSPVPAEPSNFGSPDQPIIVEEDNAAVDVVHEHPQAQTASSAEMFKVEADQDLLEIFLDEGAEILDASEDDLATLQSNSNNPTALQSLQRGVHTLKGGARMCGITPIGDLSHSLENLFNLLVESQAETTEQSFDLLTRCFDRLVHMIEQVRTENQVLAADALIAQVDALVAGEPVPDSAPDTTRTEENETASLTVGEDTTEPAPEQAGTDDTAAGAESTSPSPEPTQLESNTDTPVAAHGDRHPQDTIRVRAESMADMINLAGEVSIFRSRLEQQMGSFQFNISELGSTVSRIREQLRKLEIETEAQILSRYQSTTPDDNEEFDPLELDRFSQLQQLSRALVEGANDLTSIQDALDSHTREAETLLLQQSRVNTELQEGLMSTRMVPFKGIVPRLARIVRQTSRELGKKVDLVVVGDNEEIDRTILDRMTAPLEHTVRNAISHGIELPKDRKTAGKPLTGKITLELGREGSEVVIRIRDDGRGIDLEKLHKKALDMGLLSGVDQVPDKDLVQLVLESGMSTANEVSQIAGRGVGMDVVRSEVRQLGGTLDIHTDQGKGTQFTVRLPFTLSMNQALLVEIGDDPYAVPLAALDGVIRLSPEQLAKSYGSDTPLYEYAGNSYKLMHLGSLLGVNLPMVTDADSKIPILLVRAGDQRVALQVDRLIGSREIVVKSLGVQLSTVPGIAGATILGDGSVVLILELGALVRIGATSHTDKVFEVTEEQERDEPHITVMVVDDSITMRKVATRLLERHNMHVETAKDGLDALAQLQDIVPDVLLLDIEMPRMDGFELASHMRRDDRWKDVPIIMITSRTGDKHRDRAMEIGVNHYMGKPYKENDLLNTIHKAVGRYDIGGATHG